MFFRDRQLRGGHRTRGHRRGGGLANQTSDASAVRGHPAHVRGAAGHGGNRLAHDARRRLPSSRLHTVAVAGFLVFAVVVWPTWVPLSLFPVERSAPRKKALGVLLAVGACVSIYAAWLLALGRPTAHVNGHSLAYSYTERGSGLVLALYLPVYVAASVVPFFISTMDRAKLMGIVLVGSLVATFIIERQALTSVWCFFSAILSGIIVLSITAEQRAHLSRRATAQA